MAKPEYPEHEKLRKLQGANQAEGDFLERLLAQGLTLCTFHEEHTTVVNDTEGGGQWPEKGAYRPHCESTESLLARFHGIDQAKLSAEKDAMVEAMRAMSRSHAGA